MISYHGGCDIVKHMAAAGSCRGLAILKSGVGLQISVERSLPAILPSLLQHAFVSTFEKTLIPAFEKACQNMFSQVGPATCTGNFGCCFLGADSV